MRKGQFKTQVCDCCGIEKRKSIEFFRTQNVKGQSFHLTCRECEDKRDWKNGKLLCHICGEYLDPEEFQSHSDNKHRGNRDSRCKKCKQSQMKETRKLYSEEQKLHYLSIHRYNGAKDRAKKKNIPCDITAEYIKELYKKQNGKCAVSGIDMTLNLDKGRSPYNISIDQINSKGGYTKDNVQLVCMAVNQLKSDFEMNDVLFICKSILSKNN
jgi:hypothetical protein